MMKNKKGVSPVVATVLLIAIVIVLAIIIFLWASSFFEERAEKFGKSEDQACSEVILDAYYNSDGTLDVTNKGNIPVYGLKVEVIEKGESEMKDYSGKAINEGESIVIGDDENLDIGEDVERLKIIPILLGKSKDIKKSFVCDEKYATEILIE